MFRRQVAGESLVKGVVGRPGQNDLSFDMRIPSTDLSWSVDRFATTRWARVDVNGEELMGSSCRRAVALDAAAESAVHDRSPFGAGVRADDTVRIRLHLAPDSGHSSEVARDADVRLGLGLYTRQGPRHRVAGKRVPVSSESGGHAWLASRWEQSSPGNRSLRVNLPVSDRPRLVSWLSTNAPRGRHEVSPRILPRGAGQGGAHDEAASEIGGDSSGSGYVVQPGEAPTVVLRPSGAAPTPTTRLGLVFSDLVH